MVNIKEVLLLRIIIFFIKKPKTVEINKIKQNEQLAKELQKPVI